MQPNFTPVPGLLGRFAIVKLWPELKTAEDECIARIKIAATALGVHCFEILADGRLLEDTSKVIAKSDVDFVLHLHYDTPKLYDAFSIVALWNPTYFYHEWGYARTSRNLLTHDDFISCSSTGADHHVERLIRKSATHLPPCFNLYHSIADTVHPPSLGDYKLFYAGINWDALRGGVSRHQELLKQLDKTGHLRIYGPTIFLNVKVWSGYDSYVREIPFDGVSMMDEISKAGIALVLSSQAHKDSELMSNRLFESVAAGALVICDENKFAQRFFGDCLFYIDSRCPVEQIREDIENHLAWVKANPDKALAMIKKSQDIFKAKFSLKRNLTGLYQGLQDRKHALQIRQLPTTAKALHVRMYLLMYAYSPAVLAAHLASASAQEYQPFTPVLVIDRCEPQETKALIVQAIADACVAVELLELDYFDYGIHPEIKVRRKSGQVIWDILAQHFLADAVVFVASNEKLLSNHLTVLAGALSRDPGTHCAATSVIHLRTGQAANGVHEKIDFRQLEAHAPIGYARFIFRISALSSDLDLALPYLDRKPMAVLVGQSGIQPEIPSTVLLHVEHEYPSGPWDEGQENELIGSFSPAAFAVCSGHEIVLPVLGVLPAPVSQISIKASAIRRIIGYFSWPFFVGQFKLLREHGIGGRVAALKRELNTRQA